MKNNFANAVIKEFTLALDTITTICKGRDEWCLERDDSGRMSLDVDECNELMPEEVENKVFSSI